MKKLLSVILIALLLLSASIGAQAETATLYRIEEMGMSVSVPEELVVFTRDIPADDPRLSAYGFDREQLLSTFRQSNIYLNAIPTEGNYEIVVTMIDSPLSDFNALSDSMLQTLLESLESQFENYGLQVDSIEIYPHSQAKFGFFRYSREGNGSRIYSQQYYTVYGGKAINFTLHSYAGEVDSVMAAQLKAIVDSAAFDGAPVTTPEPEITEGFLYTDEETGLCFELPSGWKQAPLSKPRQYIDVKFSSEKEPGMSILYGSTDLWELLPASEKAGLTRAELDNDFFTISDLEEAFGLPHGQVQSLELGGRSYYMIQARASSEEAGLSVPITMVIRIENGCFYMLQFSGNEDSSLYPDFRSLLESLRFPGDEAADSAASEAPSPAQSESDDAIDPSAAGEAASHTGDAAARTSSKTGLAVFLLILLAAAAAVIVFRKRRK